MKEILVSKDALKANLGAIRLKTGNLKLLCVLRNDAYGLGLLPTARLLYDEGVRFFAVDDTAAAARLREAGFADIELLLTHSTSDPGEIERLLDLGMIATVGSQETAVALSGLADRRGTVAEAHLCIDTGFGAYGFSPLETDTIVSVFQYMKGIAVSGIFTKYDPSASRGTRHAQARAFQQVLDKLKEAKMETGLVYAASSSIVLGRLDPKLPLFDAVCVGSSLAGLEGRKLGLTQAVRLRSRISEAVWRPAGAVLGGVKLKKAARIGIIPLGTADGLGVDAPPVTRSAAFGSFRRKWISPVPAIRLADGKRLKLVCPPGTDHAAVRLDGLSANVGTEVFIDVNPLYCMDTPRNHT